MKNPKGRINKALYFFGGGVGAATVANPAQGPQTFGQEVGQINQGYNNQFQQFGNFVGNQPLLSQVNPLIQQASTGASGFFNQLLAPGSPLNNLFGPGSGYGTAQNFANSIVGGTGINQGISNAQSEINTGGYATPQQARDTNQATLAAASAGGSAFSPNTLGQLAINEDQARQARVNTAYGQLGSAQGLQSGALGQLGQGLGQVGQLQGLQTGGLNQLLGAASSGVGALQGETGAFTALTDPILSFLSNMFGQNTQSNIAQAQLSTQAALAGQSKNAGFINSGISSIGSIAGGLAMSDERLKKNIKDTGLTKDGVPLKTFEYKTRPGTTYLGVLAQDVEKEAPESVVEDPLSGIKLVDAERFPIFPIHFAGKAA